ncbi:hypothetical protein ACJMK2_042738, partial [Sinanodonta woodiana]
KVQYSKNNQQELIEPLDETLPEVADHRHVDQSALMPEPEQEENPEKHENKLKIMNDPDKALPVLQKIQIPAEFPCLYGFGKSKWPIHCYAKLGFNVNAQHGGCAGLILVSNSYGSEGSNTTAEIFFLTTGFDANHFSVTSIGKCNAGHFGAENEFVTDEQGNLIGSHMFGSNHVMLMTNYGCYGNLKHGIYVQGPPESDKPLNLPLNVNGSLDGEHGGGVTLVLCSNSEHSAMYMIRSGHEGDYMEMVLLSGDNIWKFSAAGGGVLQVIGAGNSNYGIFHNRQNLTKDGVQAEAKTYLAQAMDGGHITTLISSMPVHATYIVMCSSSNGTEDNTAGALYHISIESSNLKESKCMTGSHGNCYEKFDLWTFYVSSGKLVVTGPSGPCRYALLSDSKDDGNGGEDVCSLTSCLGTGEPLKIQGAVKITGDEIVGVVDRPSKIIVQEELKILKVFEADELEKVGDRYTFCRTWKEKEKTVGIHLVKIFAARKHVASGIEVFINLEGSPQKLIRQKAGVIYALNAGGPDYHALSNIIYTSEFSQFASFTYDVCYGTRCKALGGVKTTTNIPQILCNTHDGFLNCTTRSPGVEPQDEQKVNWVIEDIPNGKYTIRVHMNSKMTGNLMVSGMEISDQMTEEYLRCKPSGDILSGHEYTSYYGNVPVTVHNGQLELYAVDSTMISGFALLDSAYKDETMTEEELTEEEQVKSLLSEQIQTIKRALLRKKITLVGWSQNLLQNASGENGDLSHWNTTGSWNIHEGGYQTEKAFVTSYMESEKYQEVRLTDYFSAKYLDTAPDIQVSEWYREGVCGGGFYSMEASILDEHGNVSRDDKFWGGHYGVIISASIIRVKREELPAEGDEFEDIKQDEVEYTAIKVANDVLSENQTLLKEVLEESNAPLDTQFEKQTAVSSTRRQTKMKRKHEIRVFVSSTFRDFTREREKIIKKTFREMNQICADHGVFFTYVDLRWGITKEQTMDGKTIAICLQEIDRCRPYFICLLGERFGWCQTREKPDELLNNSYNYALDNFPPLSWIDQNRYDTSVTQLEVMHGVLNDIQNRKAQRSFFYIREPIDPATVTKEEYERMASESAYHKEKQMALIATVRMHKDLNIRDFRTPEDVCELIQNDLVLCVEQDFPKGTEPTNLEKQRMSHGAFAENRQHVFVGRQEYIYAINEQRKKNLNTPFVILGESGSGKSAIVANWAKEIEEQEPDTFLFVHFIGSTAESALYLKIIRRICEEIKDYFKIDQAIPSTDTHLIQDLGKWIHMAGTRAKCVFILDAVNQLNDGTGDEGPEHDLMWIPSEIPPNVFFLMSTLPGRAMDAVKKFEWPTVHVGLLKTKEKEEYILKYLTEIYGKTLDEEQKDRIIKSPNTDNPLFMKVLLDEFFSTCRYILLRSFFIYRKNIVHDVLTAVWCASRGLSESEITELLNISSQLWSPIYISLSGGLINRNGILNFSHDHMRQAVEKRYLSTPESKKQIYLKLSDYFSHLQLSDRVVEELPNLLLKAGEMDRLKFTISNLDVFSRLMKSEDGKFELIKAWHSVGDISLTEEAYLQAVEKMDPQELEQEKCIDLFRKLGSLFIELGLLESAMYQLGLVNKGQWELDKAVEIYKEAISRQNRIKTPQQKLQLCEGLLGLATVFYLQDNMPEAKKLLVRSLELATDVLGRRHHYVAAIFNKLGQLCYQQGRIDEGLGYFLQDLKLTRSENGMDHPLSGAILNDIALVYDDKADKLARPLYQNALLILKKVYGPMHIDVATVRYNLGANFFATNYFARAKYQFLEAHRVFRTFLGDDHPDTIAAKEALEAIGGSV